jgi:hypothetical protein
VFARVKAVVRNSTVSPSTQTAALPCDETSARPPWSVYGTWLQLSKGMPAESVKQILGEPDYTTILGAEELWYYGGGKYRVFLIDGKFDRWTD